MATTKTRAKTAKAAEAETDDLEDLDEATEADKPATAGSSKDEEDDSFGTKDLAALIKKLTGKEYSTRQLRTLIRAMHRKGELSGREITRENPTRYAWTGADDPEVKAIVKAVKSGRIEAANKEVLDDLKARGAKKREEKRAARAKAKAESLDDDESETSDEADESEEGDE